MIRLRALNPKDLTELPHALLVVPELIAGCEEQQLSLGRVATVVWWGTPGAPLLNSLVQDTVDEINVLIDERFILGKRILELEDEVRARQ